MNSAIERPDVIATPHYPIAFDRISLATLQKSVERILDEASAAVSKMAAADLANLTWNTTLGALESVSEKLEFAYGIIAHLDSVDSSAELREIYHALQPKVSAFYAQIPLDEHIFARLKAYSTTDQARNLDPIRARLLKKTILEFIRHGAQLGTEQKERLKVIEVELGRITNLFSNHVLDSTNAFAWQTSNLEDLAGLPQAALDAAREDALAHGQEGWRFTLQQPSLLPMLTHLDNREIRRHFWTAYATRAAQAPHDNRDLIVQILELRREKANLLGYANFADYILEPRMAESGGKARAFVDHLTEVTRPHFEREREALAAWVRANRSEEIGDLMPWDVNYYAEKQRQALYDFDDEALRPYFERDRVLQGAFSLANKLYGVEIRPAQPAPVWHESVKAYEVFDGDRRLGLFYTDFAPRTVKRGGAWMNGLLVGTPANEHVGLHIATICGSLTDATQNRPALLTHDEVETVFHEFGHLMHHMLSEVPIRALAATNVAWDFVELPSQIMENWCWEREALDTFARHYETGATIPDDLLSRMIQARTFRAASHQMRQLSFADLDLALHMQYDPERDGDVVAYVRKRMEAYSPVPLPADYAMIASFSHLFGAPVGYGAAYYSYKWAEVLDADAFSAFRKAGIFDATTGRHFRQTILARGDCAPAAELFRAFMGRDPDPNALLVRNGLA
jgi:oligopeptidase A